MKQSFVIVFSFFIFVSLVLLFVLSGKNDQLHVSHRPNDWFFSQRAYPSGKINHEIYVQSLKQTRESKKLNKEETFWEFAGPYNIGGRLTDVESHPDNPEIFIGAASGGIFKLSPDGSSWESIFDDALSLSIGDIAIAPSNCDIIYVGTGEANCGGGSQTYDGVGIYKSIDGGESWEHMGLEESRNVGRIAVHPLFPDIAYVAAMGSLFGDSPDRGIYKTIDGGETWNHILFVSDSTGGIDIVIDQDTPNIVYAALWERIRRPNRRSYGGLTCGIYKTTDEGENWNELSAGLPSPGEDVGRIGIDISESNPNILYAIYADKTGYFEGVYTTQNGGQNWSQTNDWALSGCYQSYGWWFGRIDVDPIDPSVAYVIGFDLYKTSNGGTSWNNISSNDVHVDQHGLYIHPIENNRVFLGNDGGFYMSDDGGSSWEWINTLPITQFYTCEIDNQFPARLYGGTQDNGTNRTLTGNTNDWVSIYGGDGFYVLVDPEDNNYVYAEYQYGGLGRSINGGNSFSNATSGISSGDRKNWNTPVIFDPANPEILYYGSNKLYKSTNRAVSWTAISPDLTNGPGVNLTYGTITTISVSPVNPDIIYAGTDDGNVWVSTEGGLGWDNITDGLPNRWVTRVAADPWDENIVYVTFSGYRWDEFIPHIFRSEDKGQIWTDISSNLPETPLNDIIIDPEDNHTIYVASDVSVFVSHNLGESWQVLGVNLPLLAVNDLDLHNETRKLLAATFGRSMYTYDLYQDTITTSISEKNHLNPELTLNIIPNPVKPFSRISIELKNPVEAKVFILDISGKICGKIMKNTFQTGHNEIGFNRFYQSALVRGIYTLVVVTDHKTYLKKFVVE